MNKNPCIVRALVQLEDDDIESKSKTTQAIKLFSELKSPVEVAIALDLPVDHNVEV